MRESALRGIAAFRTNVEKQLKPSMNIVAETHDYFCYMLCVTSQEETLFTDLQKELNLQGVLSQSGDFHVTVRHVKRNDYEPFVDYLKTLDLPVIKGVCREWAILGKNKDALVIQIESTELHSYFKEINQWLLDHDYPNSDYPEFRPHITLTYDPGVIKPEWKKQYEKAIELRIHIVKDTNDNVVFRREI